MRKLTIDGREWLVKVGRSFLVARTGHGGIRLNIPLDKVTGYTWRVIEEEQDDHRFEVTPSMMAEAIRKAAERYKAVL